MLEVGYDYKSAKSIELYAKKLVGKTFREVCENDFCMITQDGSDVHVETLGNKGGLGQLIEERYFHYRCNSDSNPDFAEAGVELKVTPYRIDGKGNLSAKERLILTMIDYYQVVNETFETSHLWHKAKCILLIYYLYKKEIENRIDYPISYTKLFTPPAQDIEIIKHDFRVIQDKIRAGKAHELSEGDTMYLGAATKASSSADRRSQPFSMEPAKPRAFSFKNSYMTYVLNNYIVAESSPAESIVKDATVESFEDYVVTKIDSYRGKSEEELCSFFDVNYDKKPKNLEAMLAYRMLGIKGNSAEEFEKANIAIKTIRIGSNGKIKENMSFPTFKFKELVLEEWDDSAFGNYLRSTRFLFVVYKFDENNVLRFRGSQFWNIPYNDLENEVKDVWERTKRVLLDGLEVKCVNGKYQNNFPKQSENRVSHVRPHAQNQKDTFELPDGRMYPKQCFWLNNSYILSQLREDLK